VKVQRFDGGLRVPGNSFERRGNGAQRGATLVEYALAVTAICLAITGAANVLTNAGTNELANQANCVQTRPPPPSCQIRAITTTTGSGPVSTAIPTTSTTAAPTTTTTIAPTTTTLAPTTTTLAPTTTTAVVTTTTAAPTTTTSPSTVGTVTFAASSTNQGGNGTWGASITLLAKRGSTNVNGATINISATLLPQNTTVALSCQTAANGQCTIADNGIPDSSTSIRITVTGLSGGTPTVTFGTGTAPAPLTLTKP
jgi:Flp pilus assembly pilin Flp